MIINDMIARMFLKNQIMKKENFLAAIQKTFLEQILFIGPDDFINPTDIAGPQEKVIGEMNELEKAVYTVFFEKIQLVKNRLKDMGIDERNVRFNLEINNLEKTIKNLRLMEEVIFFEKLLWLLIGERLRISSIGNLGVRENFTIVKIKPERNCADCPLKIMCTKSICSN